ncbi:Heterokaryon incompatibility protein-domain-containing protein [Fusarium keratoplasticum]|nr:Heterokaryon incompatibility protein-domain-containing protein [Fusarium keratoplasticum]
MPTIYSKAWNVAVWIGDRAEDSERAMDLIPSILNLKAFERILQPDYHDTRNCSSFAAFANLIKRSWFSRRWVVQEVALARRVSLRCGNKIVNWDDFADAVELFLRNLDRICTLYDASGPLTRGLEVFNEVELAPSRAMFSTVREVVRKGEGGTNLGGVWSIEELVVKFTSFEASDPRDTVYAFLSLANDVRGNARKQQSSRNFETPTFHVEYKKDVKTVYIDFVKFCVETTGSLDILCRRWALSAKGLVLLPSWIGIVEPTYSVSLVGPPGQPRYNASGSLPAKIFFATEAIPAENESMSLGETSTADYASSTPITSKRKRSDEGCTKSQKRPNVGSLRATAQGPAEQDSNAVQESQGSAARATENPYSQIETRHEDEEGTQTVYTGWLDTEGIILGEIRDVSPRVVEGTIPREALNMCGLNSSSQDEADRPNRKTPDTLWRTLVADRTTDGKTAPLWYRRACGYIMRQRSREGDLNISRLLANNTHPESVVEYLKAVQKVVWSRVFFKMALSPLVKPFDDGRSCGFGSQNVDKGNIVCLLYGCSVPVVFQVVSRGERQNFVVSFKGECYVHGFMNGEYFASRGESDYAAASFRII